MPVKKKTSDKRIYQLKVTLIEIRPPIWRRILVPYDISVDKLHRVLQIVMGWFGNHLHEFIIGGVSYGKPTMNGDDLEDEKRFKLHQLIFGEKIRFYYRYDFGDCWDHEILVEKILPVDEGTRYPICLTGKRACPPEDCGGAPGYESLLEIVKDPSHPEHDDMLSWLPRNFYSERFDLESVNRILAKSRR